MLLASVRRGAPEVAAHHASRDAMAAQLRAARAGYMPKATLSASLGHTSANDIGSASWDRSPSGVGVNVTQPLFDGLRTANQVKEAHSRLKSSTVAITDSEATVLLGAASALASLRRERDVLVARRDNVRVLRQVLQGVVARAKSGDLARTDIAMARSRLDQAVADTAMAEGSLGAAEAEVFHRIGSVPSNLGPVQLPESLLPASLEEALTRAIKFNPALNMARLNVEADHYRARAAQGARAPNVAAEGQIRRDVNTVPDVSRRDSAQVTLRVSLAVMDGGLARAQVDEARARYREQVHGARTIEEAVIEAASRSYQQWKHASPRLAAARQQVQQAMVAVKGVREQARGGERSMLEVLDMERELVNARIAVAMATADRTVAAYSLLGTTGVLSEANLLMGAERRIAAPAPVHPVPVNPLPAARNHGAPRALLGAALSAERQ